MSYQRNNLYVGKYEVPASGVVPLPDATWHVNRAFISDEGLELDDNGDHIALILKDGKFWPVIALLTPEQADHLQRQLLVCSTRLRLDRIQS